MHQQLQSTVSDTASNASRSERRWVRHALELLEAEAGRSGWTPLLPFRVEGLEDVDIYLKDESLHPTGSLKHRLARSLFVLGLCNGDIGHSTTIIEASSGSTAVSEAYFAQILDLPFVAVLPTATSPEKVALIKRYGGAVHVVDDPTEVVAAAQRLADSGDAYFMDQFTYASQATDWRRSNIASELFSQLSRERHPIPDWVVVGAGTGGTSTSIARHARYNGIGSRVAVVDPDGSAFYEGWRRKDTGFVTCTPSRIEGIGRTRVEASFVPNLIDEMIQVPDGASIATMRWASERLGRRVGPSTGTNIWGALQLALRMRASRREGSIVTLICDTGDRYASTYYDDNWVAARGISPAPWAGELPQLGSPRR